MNPPQSSHTRPDLQRSRRAFLFAREQIACHGMGSLAARDFGDPAAPRQRSTHPAADAPDAPNG